MDNILIHLFIHFEINAFLNTKKRTELIYTPNTNENQYIWKSISCSQL